MTAADQETATVSEPWRNVELDDATIEALRRLLFPQHTARKD